MIFKSYTGKNLPQATRSFMLSSMPELGWQTVDLSAELNNPAQRYFVLLTEDDAGEAFPIGYLSGYLIADEFEITRVYVEPTRRGRGLGKRLMSKFIDAVKQSDVRLVLLEVRSQNLPARRAYEAAGFETVAVRKNYYKLPSDDALVMHFYIEEGRA